MTDTTDLQNFTAVARRALVDDAWLDSEDITTLDVASMSDTLAKALGDLSYSTAIFTALVEDAWIGTEVLEDADLGAIAEVAARTVEDRRARRS